MRFYNILSFPRLFLNFYLFIFDAFLVPFGCSGDSADVSGLRDPSSVGCSPPIFLSVYHTARLVL